MNEIPGKHTPLTLKEHINKKLHYWFVQYNPLYFFSALCVVFGVCLVSYGLREMDWVKGEILLTFSIEAYEILLITGAAILFQKAANRRASVILGIIAICFLFDVTFQTEIIASFHGIGIIASAIWILFALMKLLYLLWAFQLSVNISSFILTLTALCSVAAVPHLLEIPGINKAFIHLCATWIGAGIFCIILCFRPTIKCGLKLNAWGKTVLRRASISAFLIWSGMYFYHLSMWVSMFDISLTYAHAVPFIMIPVCMFKRETSVWGVCAASMLLSCLNPTTVCLTASSISIILVLNALRMKKNSLYTVAVVSVYFACIFFGWEGGALPEQVMVLDVITASILLVMGWRLKLKSAYAVLIIGLVYKFRQYIPENALEWGTFLIIIGIISLLSGLAINLRLKDAPISAKQQI